MTGKIFFRSDMEEQPVILDDRTYRESFMKETIDYALDRFEKISRGNCEANNRDISNEIAPNNVIAFVGDRGTGKTSCMLSTINIIRQREKQTLRNDPDAVRNHFMDMLDPSFFDNEHSILDILIGKMYAEFRNDTANIDNFDQQEMRALVESFSKVKKCLKFIGERMNHDDDSLDELNHLAAGVTLKREYHNLVKLFCRWFKAKYLVISIDDIDLNTVQAFSMMELIRKYITQSNTIVLFAVKVPQLTNAVKLQLTQQYGSIVGTGNHMSTAEIALMADRYVEKFLPINCRVYMPDADAILSQPLMIVEPDGRENALGIAGDAVPALIFAKTRYLFYNTEGNYSRIIPRRLRQLRQFVMMLYSLPDYDSSTSMYDDSGSGRLNRYNKTTFKNYFLNAVTETLPASHREAAEAIFSHRDFTSLNKAVVDYFKKLSGDKAFEDTSAREDLEHSTPSELSRILNAKNMSYNISLGDVLLYLNHIDDNNADSAMSQLIFFIKSYYSILLYELYDLRCDDIAAGIQRQAPEKPLLQNQLLVGIDNLHRLVGGSYITLTDNVFLAPNNNNDRRERRLIDGDLIKKTIDHIKETCNLCVRTGLFDRIRNNDLPDDDRTLRNNLRQMVRNLRTIEFFMLGTQRYESFRSEDYRLLPDVYYNRQLFNIKNLVFDVTAPLFNILDIKAAYDRFDKDIFTICKHFSFGEYKSLYTMMTETSPDDYLHFLSSVTIRNVEILEDMCAFIKRHRNGRNRTRVGRPLTDIYATFYQTVAEYVALTYSKETYGDRYTSGNFHHIQLKPFCVLHEFLKAQPEGTFADSGVNMELFDAIANSAITQSADQNVLRSRRRYLRDQILAAITDNVPDAIDNEDFRKMFVKTFIKENGTYNTGDITAKLARMTGRLDIYFDACLDSNAAQAYRNKLTDLSD